MKKRIIQIIACSFSFLFLMTQDSMSQTACGPTNVCMPDAPVCCDSKCYPEGYTCCEKDACKPGDVCCDGKCYPKGYTCCEKDACKPGDVCCDGKCYPKGYTCCEKDACKPGYTCVNGKCYPKEAESTAPAQKLLEPAETATIGGEAVQKASTANGSKPSLPSPSGVMEAE